MATITYRPGRGYRDSEFLEQGKATARWLRLLYELPSCDRVHDSIVTDLTAQCSCETMALMQGGCKCGAMQRERERE